MYVCNEIYVHEKDKSDIIEMANEAGLSKRLFMWCDSAEPGSILQWKHAGYRAKPVEKEKDCISAQISWLKMRKIYVHPSCVNLQKELSQWKWMLNKKTGEYEDEPVAVFDDAIAALRYGIEGWRPKKRYERGDKAS